MTTQLIYEFTKLSKVFFRIWPLFLIFGVFLSFPDQVRSDVSPIVFSGGAVSPVESHETIRMDEMIINIRVRKTGYTIDALFHLFNTGPTMKQWVGFPKFGTGFWETTYDFHHFSAWINGGKVKFVEDKEIFRNTGPVKSKKSSFGETKARWMVKEIAFPGNTKTTLRIRYEAPYLGRCNGEYFFGTGRHWKGRIGRAAFTIDGSEVGGIENILSRFSTAAGFRTVSRNLMTLKVSSFEPGHDSRLRVNCKKAR